MPARSVGRRRRGRFLTPIAHGLPAVALVVGVTVAAATGPAGAETVRYRPPVEAPVIDPFRPPAGPYGPGNRGLDYATVPDTVVTASAAGVVIFAGEVAGALHVTIRHADGLRTSYSFLSRIDVVEGQRVEQGVALGTTGDRFHVGVRAPDGTYLDPAALFAGDLHPRTHLVPGGDDGTEVGAGASERTALAADVRALCPPHSCRAHPRGLVGPAVAGLADLDRRLRAEVPLLDGLASPGRLARLADAVGRWEHQRVSCTPPERPPPAPPASAPPAAGGVMVLVGGVGSTSEEAAVDRVDTAALGFAPGSVIRFSYAGGRTARPLPADSRLAAVPATSYTAADSQEDLTLAADRLLELWRQVAATRPGAPIVVIAHSQGGVVARLALERARRTGGPPPEVTLGTPHHGADLASSVAATRRNPTTRAAVGAVRELTSLELDPELPALAQLAPHSTLMADLSDRPVPSGVRFRTVAAGGDLVVPLTRTAVSGAEHATVGLSGLHAHDQLPGAAATQRELALALAGLPPTCRSFTEAVADTVSGLAVEETERGLADTVRMAALLAPPGPGG